MKKKKIIISAVTTIIGAFLVLNCVWGIYAYSYLNNYTKVLTISEGDPTYFANKDGISYSATKVKYLSFTNNLAVTDEDSNSLLIWKKLFSTKYGISIGENQYQMYVDQQGKPADRRNAPNAAEVYNENTEMINALFQQARDFWNLK